MDGIRISPRPGLRLREQRGDVDRHDHDPFAPLAPAPFAPLSTTVVTLRQIWAISNPRSQCIDAPFSHPSPHLMMYPRPYRARAACTSSCRRDEEIGADSNYTNIVRLQPASEQGINATSGQSWITISPRLCQCIIFIIMCKCPICSQSPYYRDLSEANSRKPSRDSLRDSCTRDAEAEDSKFIFAQSAEPDERNHMPERSLCAFRLRVRGDCGSVEP